MSVDSLAEAGLTESWTRNAYRCTYCDTIYSIDGEGRQHRRGHFGGNTLWTAENWKPFTNN